LIVLITGCSSGFGLATALGFARQGHAVIATLRDVTRTPADLRGQGNVAVEQLDVTSPASIDAAVARTLQRHGRIDVLVNNAGIGVLGALETLDSSVLRAVFDTNVFGAVGLTRAVLPTMREQRSGRVIFINAIGGILTTAFLGAYCASKHALDCIAAVFDLELRPFGVRVSSVYPSAFQTSIADHMQVIGAQDSPYAAATREYQAGLSARVRNGPSDLSPVVEAVIEAATSPDPHLRYLVAPHLAAVLEPTLTSLDALHQRELSLTPGVAKPS
jgi:NAD(P)-dependent dehydrogenase (short-subunit alcohol dehydrogenase family)